MVRTLVSAILISFSFVAWSSELLAQPVPVLHNGGVIAIRKGPDAQVGKPVGNYQPFIVDRQMSQRLYKSREYLEKGDYENGLALLQIILENQEDFFFNPDPDNKSHYRSLKSEAHVIISELPEDGRRFFENAYGAKAGVLLQEARTNRDVEGLRKVARNYFHTIAGYEASYLVGAHYFNRSEMLAAALHFDRLRQFPVAARRWEPMLSLKTAVCWGRAGMPEQSIATLLEMKRLSQGEAVRLGGRQVAMFQRDEDALPWLVRTLGEQPEFSNLGQEKWAMFRGDATRNASGSAANPLAMVQWKYDTIRDKSDPNAARLDQVARNVEEMQTRYDKDRYLAMPVAHPLVIDGKVIFRTMKNLRAVDVETGEILWQTVDYMRDHATSFSRYVINGEGNQTIMINGRPTQLRDRYLKNVNWRDMATGTMSSDGKLVYLIRKPKDNNVYQARPHVAGATTKNDFNFLVGIDLVTGKRVVEVGGGVEANGVSLDFAGTSFLGPPLPLGNRLYCLAEANGEVKMLVLSLEVPAEGSEERARFKLLWSQTLVLPEYPIGGFAIRGLSGISPSYGEGVMVCPTTAGSVVAVDLSRQQLMWGYRYPSHFNTNTGRGNPIFGRPNTNRYQAESVDEQDRWLDAVPTITEGRVLLTPRDSNELHCLSLLDGRILWRRPRGQALFVGAVFDDKVFVIERSQISVLYLADGSPVYDNSIPIGTPGGRGHRVGSFYYQPLASGELLTFDLNESRILAHSQMVGTARIGNLVSARGKLLSQSATSLVAFQPLKETFKNIEEALARNPNDADALLRRGETRLHLGELEQGLNDLRRSMEIKPTNKTRELIVETLLNRIRTNYREHKTDIAEIEKLIEKPENVALFRRLKSTGLVDVGEHRLAFQEFVKMAGPNSPAPSMERISGNYRVRSDRWARTQIADIYRRANPADLAWIEQQVQQQLSLVVESGKIDALRKFVNCFHELPGVNAGRRELIQRLNPKNDALEMELILLAMRDAKDAETAGFATAKLVELSLSRGRPDEVAQLVANLNGRFADVACIDGRTGREFVAKLGLNDEQRRQLAGRKFWPVKEIEVKPHRRQAPVARQKYIIPVEGSHGLFFGGWQFFFDQNASIVTAMNERGQTKWTLNISENGTRISTNVYANTMQIRGHLLYFMFNRKMMVVNAMDKPVVLWHKDLYDGPGNVKPPVRVQRIMIGGVPRMVVADQFGKPIGAQSVVGYDVACFQIGHKVVAANPRTGESYWEREDVNRDLGLQGNDQVVCVAPQNDGQAQLFHVGDGSAIGLRTYPESSSRIALIGNRILSWKAVNGKQELKLTDLVSGNVVLSRTFSLGARYQLIDGNEFAVLEPQGQFVLFSLDDGRTIVEEQVKEEKNLNHIVILRSRDTYLVMTHASRPKDKDIVVNAMTNNSPLVNGFAYGFDRQTGKRLWMQEILHQTVDVSQPTGLPVLLFRARQMQMQNGVNQFGRSQNVTLLLDTRTGDIVREDNTTSSHAPFEVLVDINNNRITYRSYKTEYLVTFTNRDLEQMDD